MMKISDLEKQLARIREKEGDLPVMVDYTDHTDWYYQTPLRESEVNVGECMDPEAPEYDEDEGPREEGKLYFGDKILNITMLESYEEDEE